MRDGHHRHLAGRATQKGSRRTLLASTKTRLGSTAGQAAAGQRSWQQQQRSSAGGAACEAEVRWGAAAGPSAAVSGNLHTEERK